MKSVMISIQPKWCDLIARGQKTIEVRKTKPKLETPFKCYIYCTLSGSNELFKETLKGDVAAWNREKWWDKKGKVIGEFVCDKIFDICIEISEPEDLPGYPFPCTGLTDKEILQYLGNGRNGYGWHISNLKVYEVPKVLGEFNFACDKDPGMDCTICAEAGLLQCYPVTKPPQSWCYVEELPYA